ncbi:MAG: pyrroline-5-carboxylate reductase [Polyangiaceae bacterium UTPRO1]|jgi:pyrroline-5-carboxylate reductase|nr:pyrroline-5-carboxylate reductase [Myxococcales bacterium]OQY64863.1 MAG: pyrroline-5-carboxylate reductase [Polyangiaceae bacterium UTPRO1]
MKKKAAARCMRAIGFIGAGNMAGALVKGLLATKRYRARELWASDAEPRQTAKLVRAYGIGRAPDNAALVCGSAIVVLAVKPQIMSAVLAEIRPHVTRRHLIVSIAAGIATRRLEAELGGRARVVRAMPNTPALVGEGMTVVVRGAYATAADERRAAELFGGVGAVVRVRDEGLMDAVTGLSGSGPAYVYRFAEGLIAGAVAAGLSVAVARRLTYQTLRGAAAMLQETGQPPEELRAMVSSPGGTTLAGLAALDERGFAAAAAAAVTAATRRGRELGRG